jgi:fructoselysine-6-P-deglycase FrlB-like protein
LNLLDSTHLPSETVYLLGNSILYPVALYASFKFVEFFGTTAIPHKLEEFFHSPIFGTRKSDHLWIFGQNEKPIRLSLEKLGIPVTYFELYDSDMLTQSFKSIFCLQYLILLLAERHGYTELQYLLEMDKLKTSSDIIY